MADAPRFLCEEMLVGLGRWLRIASYDTAIAERGPRIETQAAEVVGILVAAEYRDDARRQNVGESVHRPARIAVMGNYRRQLPADAEPPFGFRQQHHPAACSDPAVVKRGGDFLELNRWKGERRSGINVMADVPAAGVIEGLASATAIYATSTVYATPASPSNGAS